MGIPWFLLVGNSFLINRSEVVNCGTDSLSWARGSYQPSETLLVLSLECFWEFCSVPINVGYDKVLTGLNYLKADPKMVQII